MAALPRLRYSNLSTPTTLIPLRSQNLIIQRPQIHPQLLPSSEMISRRHRPADTLLSPDRPVLIERRRALNTWCIRAYRFVDIVRPAVTLYGTFVGSCSAWVVVAVGF